MTYRPNMTHPPNMTYHSDMTYPPDMTYHLDMTYHPDMTYYLLFILDDNPEIENKLYNSKSAINTITFRPVDGNISGLHCTLPNLNISRLYWADFSIFLQIFDTQRHYIFRWGLYNLIITFYKFLYVLYVLYLLSFYLQVFNLDKTSTHFRIIIVISIDRFLNYYYYMEAYPQFM